MIGLFVLLLVVAGLMITCGFGILLLGFLGCRFFALLGYRFFSLCLFCPLNRLLFETNNNFWNNKPYKSTKFPLFLHSFLLLQTMTDPRPYLFKLFWHYIKFYLLTKLIYIRDYII